MQPYTELNMQYIEGKWCEGTSGKPPVVNKNPYNGDTLMEITPASAADVDRAYRAIEQAQEQWGKTLYPERCKIMIQAAELLEQHKEEFAGWLVKEAGSTRIKAALEIEQVSNVLYAAAGLPARAKGYIVPSTMPGQESRVYREPLGVVAMISPWNFPLMLSMRTVAPALALGNGVLLKPSEETPVTGGTLIAKLFEEAGVPKGVIGVVIGHVDEIGDLITEHDVPGIVSFTGSTPVGKRIGELAMKNRIKHTALELGGNAPFVVLDDADIEAAVDALVVGRFMHQGQICMSTNRAIVDDRIYDSFIHELTYKVKQLKYGDPNKPDTAVGPLISQDQADKVRSMIAQAKKDGAEILVGEDSGGTLVPPHLLGGVQPGWQIAEDEIFGPVLPVLRARDEQDALALANRTQYGLSSAVFSTDRERAVQFARKLKVGMTHVNGISVDDQPTAPFGGEKNSGIGRFNDEWAVEEFTRVHWVTVQHTPLELPF